MVVLRKMSIGVPIKVLHEAEGHIVTCETNTGEVYRGKLIEAEDNMNCQVISVSNVKVDFMPNTNYNCIESIILNMLHQVLLSSKFLTSLYFNIMFYK